MFKNPYDLAEKEIIISSYHYKTKFDKDPAKVVKAIAAHKTAKFIIEDNDVLLCSDVYYLLCEHTYIKELELRKKIQGKSLVVLCALMDDNSTIQKIKIANQVLPQVTQLGQELDYLSACLALNVKMQGQDNALFIDETATEVLLESPRLLLFPAYCKALIRHPVASKIIVKDPLTLPQLLGLNSILANNPRISTVVINGLSPIDEPAAKPKQDLMSSLASHKTKLSLETEAKVLQGHIALNMACAEIRAGSRDSLRVVDKLSDAQKAAVVTCLQLGNAVKVLELPEVDETLLQAIPIEGSLVELRFACQLGEDSAAKQASILNAFLRTNLSVLDVVCKDYNDRLNERMLNSEYKYASSSKSVGHWRLRQLTKLMI